MSHSNPQLATAKAHSQTNGSACGPALQAVECGPALQAVAALRRHSLAERTESGARAAFTLQSVVLRAPLISDCRL